MAKRIHPWLDSDGKWDVRTCATIAKYVAHETGLPIDSIRVTRTNTFVTVSSVKDGKLVETKVRYVGSLYVVKEADLAPAIAALK